MELKNLLLAFLLGYCSVSFSQTAISGHINLEKDIWEQKVFLSKVSLEENTEQIQGVAWSPISEDGSFSFHKKHISDKDAMYRMYVNRVQKIINDTIAKRKEFILSKEDNVFFQEGKVFFAEYKNSNSADAEWQKMLRYQKDLSTALEGTNTNKPNLEDTISEAYAAKLKAYTKDSLKILLVKLIGVKQLDKKGLLNTDIAENPEYYLNLLTELRESDMERSEYQFLSRKLAYLTQDVVEQKYQWSKAFNIILGLFAAGLVFLVYRLKRKQKVVLAHLSKQEINVQTLILQGKSNKEIASELFISLSTVKTHITNIYSKLQVSNRQELLRKTQNS